MSSRDVTFKGIKKIYDRQQLDGNYYHEEKPVSRAGKIKFINDEMQSWNGKLAARVKLWDYNFPSEFDDAIRNVWGTEAMHDFVMKQRITVFQTQQMDKKRFVQLGFDGRTSGWLVMSNVNAIFEPDEDSDLYEPVYAAFKAWGKRFDTAWKTMTEKLAAEIEEEAARRNAEISTILGNAALTALQKLEEITKLTKSAAFVFDDRKGTVERIHRRSFAETDPQPRVDPLDTWEDEAIEDMFGLLWDFHEFIHESYIAVINYALLKAEIPF